MGSLRSFRHRSTPDNTSPARHTSLVLAACLGLAAIVAGIAPAGTAHATPIDDKRAQAAAIQDQIEQNGMRIDELSEQYNGAQLALQTAQQNAADAKARIDAAEAETARLRQLVKERAASVYKRATSGSGFQQFDLSDHSKFEVRSKYAEIATQRDDAVVGDLQVAKEQLSALKVAAEHDQVIAQGQQAQIAQAKSEIESANAQQQQLLSKVQGELQQLIAQEQARRAAEAAARARARFAPRLRGAIDASAMPNLPPPSGRAAAAIQFAKEQLGKPYRYAATGPDSYDCSGLTMRAWGAAGVGLADYSGAQYSGLPHVPLDQMQPGDLVFWGAGGSSHVGLYVGGGMMIHAPHTGDVVRVAPVYGSPVGAARPT